jgi:hypothetical protein
MTPDIVEEFEGRLGSPELQSRLLTMALTILSSRALVWAAALGGGVVWGFTVAHPDVLRIVSASLYCATVLFPVLWRDSK